MIRINFIVGMFRESFYSLIYFGLPDSNEFWCVLIFVHSGAARNFDNFDVFHYLFFKRISNKI